ncbi:MAG: YfcE family phosphodiesterase [Dehalococcoidales bacterium]|nr:YfcE family phosphodiesterase [Dehalococcoidales bacterium]
MAQITVLADTHVRTLRELPQTVTQAIKEAEWVVHCGDYTSLTVVEELQSTARNFVGVYGNSDPEEVRRRLPAETVIELEGRRIAVTHPYWGGPPDRLEEKLIARFPSADVILFGHTHDSCNMKLNDVQLFNPGQGYSFHTMPLTIGIMTVSKQELKCQIMSLGRF